MEFDIRNYPGKYAMHCKTEEEAKEFLAHLHSIGKCWATGDSYISYTHWNSYRKNTAYAFNDNRYCKIEWYENNGFTILEWADFSAIKEKPKPQPATITDSERKYLLTEMKELLEEYDYVCTESALNKIIDEWARNKATLINAFREHPNYVDGKFMIIFEKALAREMNIKLVRDFSRYITNTVVDECLSLLPEPIDIRRIKDGCTFLPRRLWNFFENLDMYTKRTISKEYCITLNDIIPEVPVHVGEKTTRVINKICKYLGYDKHEDYNKRFAIFADAMSPTTIKRTCVLSINPLDYLTMSFGNSWSSCHTIDKHNRRGMPNSYEGRYSSGTMSYMLDEPSMVFYTVSKEKDIDSHIKIERQMYHYRDNTLVQGRLYPQDNDSGSKEIYDEYRSAVQGILSEMFGMGEWECEEGTDVIDDYVGSDGTHYRDYHNFDNCTISWSKRTAPATMMIGHNPICVDCGRLHHQEQNISCCGREWVVCADCGERVIADNALYYDGEYYCSDCVVECPHCCRMVPRSTELRDIDGEIYCEHCFAMEFVVCADCGQIVRRSDAIPVGHFDKVCPSCFEKSYTTCPDCGQVYRKGSAHVCKSVIKWRYMPQGDIHFTVDDWMTVTGGINNGEI